MSIDARAIAFRRFGLGARPGDLGKPASDIVSELLAEVAAATSPEQFRPLGNTSDLTLDHFAYVTGKRAARMEAAGMDKETQAQQMQAMPDTPRPQAGPPTEAQLRASRVQPPGPHQARPSAPAMPNAVQEALMSEFAARLRVARKASIGFGERLVLFWTNHFTVGGADQAVHMIAGAFEREAIRPHLNGSFHDMLAAAESHPAMVRYLNNERSMGPNSVAGKRQNKGLNENLAREILELHTVGVDGGYTQADVTAFARAITGWTVVPPLANDGEPGTFIFRPNMHEPGPQHVFGRDYAQSGVDQGRAVLADLAAHSKTAQHIAFKLVRHFISDTPPPAAVAAVAAAFEHSNGSLPAVHEALLRTDAAFNEPAQKLRPPVEFVLASIRALETDLEPPRYQRVMHLLGQQPYMAPSPQGWSDDSKAWLAPDSIRTRLEFANLLSQKVGGIRPVERAKGVLGPLLTEETQTTIERAETGEQALALLLMSPEFQRR